MMRPKSSLRSALALLFGIVLSVCSTWPALAQTQVRIPSPVQPNVGQPSAQPSLPAPASTLAEAVDEFKRHRIAEVYEQTGRNWAETARRLGLDRGNLHRLVRRLGVG